MKPSLCAELAIRAAGVTPECPYFDDLVANITEAITAERSGVAIHNARLRAEWHDSRDACAYADALTLQLKKNWGTS